MMLARMPIVRSVYRTLKQIFETVLSKEWRLVRARRADRVPAARALFHRVPCWRPAPEVDEKIGGGNPLITVSYRTAQPDHRLRRLVPASEVIALDLSVEDAAKLVVSAGLVAPDQRIASAAGQAQGAEEVPRKSPPFEIAAARHWSCRDPGIRAVRLSAFDPVEWIAGSSPAMT